MADQPNFTLLSESFTTISTHLKLFKNMQPLFDRMEFQLLREQVNKLSDRLNAGLNGINARLNRLNDIDARLNRLNDIDARLNRMELKMTAMDYNSNARSLNSSINRPEVQLSPLKTLDNAEVVDFPQTISNIKNLSGADINRLLAAYGLPTNGAIGEKRIRLIHYIGAYLV